MKKINFKITCAIVLVVILSAVLYGQNPEEHAPTTYTDSAGKFYIQVNMPLYLNIYLLLPMAPSIK
jgi:hypothetical protein